MFEDGRRAWPSVALDRDAFARWIAPRLADGEVELRAEELYLACACAAGDDHALAEFERRFLSEVASFLARSNPTPRFVDDVCQELRARLFLEKKIDGWSGRGALASWLRVVTLRVAANLRRQDRPHMELEDAMPERAIDPELGIIRARDGAAFRAALGDAIATLSAEDRALLRLHYVEGLNIDRIAIVFHVSRATIGRRMIDVREALVTATRRLLRDRLKASDKELESILRVVRSELGVSLSAILLYPRPTRS
jgi:RNA polymerase sigma-70 factor (ECF subfamily)